MNVILLGAPGSGKGTQGALLAQARGIARVSTGDLLRDAVKAGTPLGRRAREFMDGGLLVPDEIILGLIDEVLAKPEARRGVIMDGFPRTLAQAEAVDRLLRTRGSQVDRVLKFDVADEELVRRLLGRAAEQGRSDDTPEAIARRLAVYREQTEPLIAFYRARGILVEIPAVGGVDDIAGRVSRAMAA